MNPINRIFAIVAYLLQKLADKTRLTYKQINILIYYLLIPLSWAILIDCRIKYPVFSIHIISVWIGIFLAIRHNFREWCDKMFDDSVKFLMLFRKIGLSYAASSVIVCVFFPVTIYLVLVYLL